MKGYNFTDDVRAVLAMAREESARLRHEYVGTEHILLGLLRKDNVAVQVLESFDVDLDALADTVDRVVKKGASGHRTGPDLPYTSRAKKVLELAMQEALDLDHSYVGTEQLLLGLLREEKGIGAQLLFDAGIRLDAARARVLQILGQTPQPTPRITRAASIAAMKPWGESQGALTPAGTSASAHMAASIIELLAEDTHVGAVFAAQGIDVAKLAEALRALAKPPAASDRPDVEAPPPKPEPPADAQPSA
jgi:ATP-dependent Clp protease ATP-binding subunit ClpC